MWNPDFFEEHGYCLIDDAISDSGIADIRNTINVLCDDNLWKKAGIGKEGSFELDETKRGDSIFWIDPPEAQGGTKEFLDFISEIITSLNREFYMGVRDYECHYTRYPAGTRYMMHSDRHKHTSHRIVSFVFYLNENWTEEDGGTLRVYTDGDKYFDVLPKAGRLIIFKSEMLHEVLITNRIRESITGWMLDEQRLF